MDKLKIAALALAAAVVSTAPAKALCLFSCEPSEADAKKVFENVIKKKFDEGAQITKFTIDRFWRIDVEGAGHKSVEYYFTADVLFPKGANLDCKADAEGKVKEGCSASTYFSTTIQNQMVKERQYIEPGKTITFKDETRFDQGDGGWKGQDGANY